MVRQAGSSGSTVVGSAAALIRVLPKVAVHFVRHPPIVRKPKG